MINLISVIRPILEFNYYFDLIFKGEKIYYFYKTYNIYNKNNSLFKIYLVFID